MSAENRRQSSPNTARKRRVYINLGVQEKDQPQRNGIETDDTPEQRHRLKILNAFLYIHSFRVDHAIRAAVFIDNASSIDIQDTIQHNTLSVDKQDTIPDNVLGIDIQDTIHHNTTSVDKQDTIQDNALGIDIKNTILDNALSKDIQGYDPGQCIKIQDNASNIDIQDTIQENASSIEV
ncbi:hypothetical protein CHS0354_016541 [Potamilus streckersoni]|uniref:Uncharacterized protein n=1 Tax=Potamilus streckersoni TaxID=2493646 RepID=A0AAE0TKH7_9BIVA|nr:hypothetical protein CHS0354_016541 [Potamilus streckersoni]